MSLYLKYCNSHKAFVEYSDNIYDTHENIDYYSPSKKSKILIAFDDITADILSNKKLVTEPVIRRRKIKIFLVFITQFYLQCQKIVD